MQSLKALQDDEVVAVESERDALQAQLSLTHSCRLLNYEETWLTTHRGAAF